MAGIELPAGLWDTREKEGFSVCQMKNVVD
jgi:hypothetical protein